MILCSSTSMHATQQLTQILTAWVLFRRTRHNQFQQFQTQPTRTQSIWTLESHPLARFTLHPKPRFASYASILTATVPVLNPPTPHTLALASLSHQIKSLAPSPLTSAPYTSLYEQATLTLTLKVMLGGFFFCPAYPSLPYPVMPASAWPNKTFFSLGLQSWLPESVSLSVSVSGSVSGSVSVSCLSRLTCLKAFLAHTLALQKVRTCVDRYGGTADGRPASM